MTGVVLWGERCWDTGVSAGAMLALCGAMCDHISSSGWSLEMLGPTSQMSSPDMARKEPDPRARAFITMLMRTQQQDAPIQAMVSTPWQAVKSGPLEIWMK